MKKNFLIILLILLVSSVYPQVPGIPIIISPNDSATICPPYIFDWYDVPTATSYQIRFSLNSNFTALIIDEVVNVSQYTLPNGYLSSATYYYWHVCASNNFGNGQWTTARRVKAGVQPNPPVLLSPPNGAVNVPLYPSFSWTSVPGAIAYILQVSKSSTFDSLIYNDTVPPFGTIILQHNTSYYWRVCAIGQGCPSNWSAVFHFTTQNPSVIKQLFSEVPVEYKLYNNYPNPFNPITKIGFQIKDSRFVTLKVFDLLGREVKVLVNEKLSLGIYEVSFDGSNLPSGMYFYTIRSGDFTDTKRMLLIK